MEGEECQTIIACESSNSFKTGLWCIGSTTEFGSVSRGSNPRSPTNFINL